MIPSIERLNVFTNTWETVYNWEDPTSDGVAFANDTRYLYIVGGYNNDYSQSLNYMYKFDTQLKVMGAATPMHVGRGDTGLTVLGGNVYVLGGWSVPDFCEPKKTTEKYAPTRSQWTELPDMLFGRGDLAVATLGGYVFAIAGETKDAQCNLSVPVPYVSRYSPANNDWHVELSAWFTILNTVFVNQHLLLI